LSHSEAKEVHIHRAKVRLGHLGDPTGGWKTLIDSIVHYFSVNEIGVVLGWIGGSEEGGTYVERSLRSGSTVGRQEGSVAQQEGMIGKASGVTGL
jgi:hypothetical protein